MAQLKVKQISDFVTAVGTIHNATVGTAAGSAIGDAKSDAISTAVSADVVVKSQAISAAVSADVVVLSSAKSYADQAEADAVATAAADATSKANAAEANAKSYTNAEVVKVNTKITTEKERIDAILASAEADKDSFAEIVTLINSVDLTNDNALGTAVLSLATVDSGLASRITELESSSANGDDLTALDARVTTNEGDISGNASDISDLAGRVSTNEGSITNIVDIEIAGINTTLSGFGDIVSYDYSDVKTAIETASNDAVTESTRLGDLAYDGIGSASTAETNAKSYAKSYADGLAGNYDEAGAAVAAQAAAKTYTDTEIATLDLRIDGLEGASFEEVVANFVGATSFSSGVKFDLGNVKVFVNGLQIHEASEGIDGWRSADGLNFTVEGLGYELEGDDHIIVSGRLA